MRNPAIALSAVLLSLTAMQSAAAEQTATVGPLHYLQFPSQCAQSVSEHTGCLDFRDLAPRQAAAAPRTEDTIGEPNPIVHASRTMPSAHP